MRIHAESGLLVRLPRWLGDFVATEPAVRALFDAFAARGAAERLSFAAPARLLELFDGRFEGARHVPTERDASAAARAWRGHGAVLLFTGSWRSAWIALRSGASVRVGQARDGRGPLLTHAIAPASERGARAAGTARTGRWPRHLPRPVGTVAAELCAAIGVPVREREPRLVACADARRTVAQEFARAGLERAPLVVNAGGRPGSAKALRADEWTPVVRGLAPSRPIVLAFGPGEESEARGLAEALRAAELDARAWGDGERAPSLAVYLALLERAAHLVTTDSGPRHLARAVGTPATVLFGPTDPRHTNEGAASERLVVGRADCAPCHLERCPLVAERERACLRDAATRTVALGELPRDER